MQIWTIKKDGTGEQAAVWQKDVFANSGLAAPVEPLFADGLPPLVQLLEEEIERTSERRWIAFSDAEIEWLDKIAAMFMPRMRYSPTTHFLIAVLAPLTETFRIPPIVTFVRDDSPAKSQFEEGAPLRLVIQVGGE